MKKIIGVMGPSKPTKAEAKSAYQIGKFSAELGAVVLTGGMGGVMEEALKGAHAGGGLTLGICPIEDKMLVNKYVDIPVMTGMRGGRNYLNILSSDVVVAIGSRSAGALSEIAFALQLNKPLILVRSTSAMKKFLGEFKQKIIFAETEKDVQKHLAKLLR